MHSNAPPAANQRGRESQPSQPNTYHAHHDPSSPAKLSTTVVHALAEVMETDVTDTGFSLYDSVDPDALDSIFSLKSDGTPRSPGHLAFTVQGYRVTVYSDGHIVITPPSPSSPGV